MADGQRITPADMELTHVTQALPAATLKAARENIEREMVIQALKKNAGKISPVSDETANPDSCRHRSLRRPERSGRRYPRPDRDLQ